MSFTEMSLNTNQPFTLPSSVAVQNTYSTNNFDFQGTTVQCSSDREEYKKPLVPQNSFLSSLSVVRP